MKGFFLFTIFLRGEDEGENSRRSSNQSGAQYLIFSLSLCRCIPSERTKRSSYDAFRFALQSKSVLLHEASLCK